MKKSKKIATFKEAQAHLQKIVDEKEYDIKLHEILEPIRVFIQEKKIKKLQNLLEQYIANVPEVFWSSFIAFEIAAIFEKHLDSTAQAKTIVDKILDQNGSNKPRAFALLLNMARKNSDYSEIDILYKNKKELFLYKNFHVLYELVYYYGYKNDLNEVERLLLFMIENFKNKNGVHTARVLALKFDLSEKLQSHFENSIKNNKGEIIDFGENANEKIRRETYEMALSESERAFAALALVDLTDGIAHEYGQPATNIRFNVQYHLKQLAKAEIVDKKMIEDCLNDILKQTERFAELNKQLAPATSSQKNIEEFDFTDLVEEVINQEKLRLAEHQIMVNYHKKPIIIEFDKAQFRQILSNLMLNAIDSIAEKQKEGVVFRAKIDISFKYKNQITRIEFKDNGIGISDIIQSRIFNPFYTTKPPDKGKGLGLYIIKNILQKYKSTIRIDTNYKDGAKFIIEILKKTDN